MTTASPSEPSHRFPSTRWSRILAAPGARDLDVLARSYWRPVHAWLGARLRIRDEEAADLTQDAFAWMLATDFFARADPARGRFRALLKTALGRFAIEKFRERSAAKRGGGTQHATLDAVAEPVDPSARTPDQVLDDAWRREVLDLARVRLETELVTSGRATQYLVFRAAFLDDEELDHATIAARHEVTTTDVSNWLARCKRRYRELLREVVMETVSDEAELQDEMRWLLGTTKAGPA